MENLYSANSETSFIVLFETGSDTRLWTASNSVCGLQGFVCCSRVCQYRFRFIRLWVVPCHQIRLNCLRWLRSSLTAADLNFVELFKYIGVFEVFRMNRTWTLTSQIMPVSSHEQLLF